MALGIYKAGQGYWVRVLTATGIGLITLAAAHWAYQELSTVVNNMPKTRIHMRITTGNVTPAPGEQVELLGAAPITGEPAPVLGTARVMSFESANSNIHLRDFVATESKIVSPRDTRVIKGASYQASVSESETSESAAIPAIAIQGGAAVVILILGAAIAYYLCAIRPKMSDFLIATDLEMKKVHWSTWKDIKMQTLVVMLASLGIAAFLYLADVGFHSFFKVIGVMKT